MKRIQVGQSFSIALIEARNAKGLSQTALGEAIGLNRSTIATLERGAVKSIASDNMELLERELGVSLPRRDADVAPLVGKSVSQGAMESIAGTFTLRELAERSGCSVGAIVDYAMNG
jgi:transcriptional regulator with XRE-family HTH domain